MCTDHTLIQADSVFFTDIPNRHLTHHTGSVEIFKLSALSVWCPTEATAGEISNEVSNHSPTLLKNIIIILHSMLNT